MHHLNKHRWCCFARNTSLYWKRLLFITRRSE